MKFLNEGVLFFAFAIGVMSISSCKKEEVRVPAPTPQQFVRAQTSYFDVQNLVNEAIATGKLSFKTDAVKLINDCTTTTIDTSLNPHTVLIDFGTGCTGGDGKLRAGQIFATFNNTDLSLTGSWVHAEFQNYTVDGDQIGGSLTLTNGGPSASFELKGTLDVNSNITFEGNSGALNGSYNYIVYYESQGNQDPSDDMFYFSGAGMGVTNGGRAFGQSITTPLVRNRINGCNFFIEGTVEIDVDGDPLQILDYGDGDCDDIATITENGVVRTIQLN